MIDGLAPGLVGGALSGQTVDATSHPQVRVSGKGRLAHEGFVCPCAPVCIGLAVIAVDSIPLLGLAEVVPVVVSKRDPHVSTSEPNDVAARRSPTRPPMEGTTSAERQPKLVVTQRPVTMPTHARPPTLMISLEPLPGLMATAAIEIKRTIPRFPDPRKDPIPCAV